MVSPALALVACRGFDEFARRLPGLVRLRARARCQSLGLYLGPSIGLVFVIIINAVLGVSSSSTSTIIRAIFLAHAPLHIVSDHAQSIKLCLTFGGTIFGSPLVLIMLFDNVDPGINGKRPVASSV